MVDCIFEVTPLPLWITHTIPYCKWEALEWEWYWVDNLLPKINCLLQSHTIKVYYQNSLNKHFSLNPIVSWRCLSHWEIWHSCESETLCDCRGYFTDHWLLPSQVVSFPDHLHCLLHSGLGIRLIHKQSHSQTIDCCTVAQWSVVWEWDYFTSNSTYTHSCIP